MYTEQNSEGAAYFHRLPYQDQLKVVWQRGKLVEARRIPGFWLYLYSVNAFFVEMWICQRRYDVELVRVLTNTTELEPYIDKVSLAELLPT